MADIAGSSNNIIRPYRSPLGSPQIRFFQESTCAATAVIRPGDIVSFDTVVTTGTKRIVRAPSSGGAATNCLQLGVTSIVGVALEGSTSDGSTTGLGADGAKTNGVRKIGVAIADGHTEFTGYLSSQGAQALPVGSSLVGTNKAVVYDRVHHAFFIHSTNSTTADQAVTITDVDEANIGDTGGQVIFRFLSSNVSPAVRIGPSN